MSVSVILVAYHGEDWLPGCISSLREASRERLHLVLVDNADDGTIDELPLDAFEVDIVDTPCPMGFARANNYALTEVSSLRETVLFLNQDTLSPHRWIDPCREILDQRNGLGAVSPLIRTYDDEEWDPSFLACLSEDQREQILSESTTDPDLLVTERVPAPALLVDLQVLMEVGPFDPVFGSYYEDYDLCRRIRSRGYEVGFCTNGSVRHFSGGSIESDRQRRRRMRQVLRNRILYDVRTSDQSRWWTCAKWVVSDFPRRLVRGMVGTPSSQPPSVVLKAYRDLFGIRGRLWSGEADRRRWRHYLNRIEWPPAGEPVREVAD